MAPAGQGAAAPVEILGGCGAVAAVAQGAGVQAGGLRPVLTRCTRSRATDAEAGRSETKSTNLTIEQTVESIRLALLRVSTGQPRPMSCSSADRAIRVPVRALAGPLRDGHAHGRGALARGRFISLSDSIERKCLRESCRRHIGGIELFEVLQCSTSEW